MCKEVISPPLQHRRHQPSRDIRKTGLPSFFPSEAAAVLQSPLTARLHRRVSGRPASNPGRTFEREAARALAGRATIAQRSLEIGGRPAARSDLCTRVGRPWNLAAGIGLTSKIAPQAHVAPRSLLLH